MNGRKLLTLTGGSTKLGRILGLPKQTFYQWERIPAEYVPLIAETYDIPRHEMRPDLWGAPE